MTLKSLNFSLLVVTVKSEDLSLLADELHKKRLMAPDFFHNAPMVVHVENETANLDLLQIKKIVMEHEFILVGISGELLDSQKSVLHAAEIAILRNVKKQVMKEINLEDKLSETKPQQGEIFVANEVKTKIINGRVRSGQEIHAQYCDLVINGDVSPGAVIIADGSIHVYGALRGRAIAGAMGDKNAAVFCRVLAPELLSIGGVYKLNEALPAEYIGKSCIISLENEKMTLESLN